MIRAVRAAAVVNVALGAGQLWPLHTLTAQPPFGSFRPMPHDFGLAVLRCDLFSRQDQSGAYAIDIFAIDCSRLQASPRLVTGRTLLLVIDHVILLPAFTLCCDRATTALPVAVC